ncbi:MAG: ABC transporter permease [Oscillospiraceae bacterium]|nr:ABC transporter permease [Oscillospiraceae bacterium]
MTNKKTVQINKGQLSTLVSNFSFILIFAAIFIGYLIINQGATTWSGVMNILRHSAVVGIIAFGMGLVIITGGIDLSVGSMLALVGGMSVVVFNATNSIIVTLLFSLALGGACGLINGLLIGKMKMPPFIVTLATMLIYRSIAQYYLRTTGSSIYNMDGTLSSYDAFYGFGQAKALTIPVVGLVFLVICAIMVFMSTNTKFGKTVYALGSNEKAARLAGINVEWTSVLVYVITGLLTGIAAFLWLAMNGSVDPATLGKSNEMYAIAAVVIGGISMSGGKGKILGIAFGAMSYTIIDKIIASLGFDALINDTIKGSILLLAVMVQIFVPMIRQNIRKASKVKENA